MMLNILLLKNEFLKKQEPPQAGPMIKSFIIKYGSDLDGKGHINVRATLGEIKILVLSQVLFCLVSIKYVHY